MLNYFTLEQAQQFSFYRLPKVLCTDKEFETLSTNAKLLYGLLLDRLSLSIKNQWVDVNNHAYIFYKVETASQILHCSVRKGKDLFVELEAFGLIQRKKQGFGKPAKIYVMSFTHDMQTEKVENLKYDYYSLEDTKQFSFYRIPVALFENSRFESLSTDAKLLYGILLDRLPLSVKYQWVDNENHTFIYFKTEEAQKMLNCCEKKSRQLFIELEKAELLQRKKQGFGKPNALYIMNFIEQKQETDETVNAVQLEQVQCGKNCTYENVQTGNICTYENMQTGKNCTYEENININSLETFIEKPCNISDSNAFSATENQNSKIQTGKNCTYIAVNSALHERQILHHHTGKNCTYGAVDSAPFDRYILHSNYTNINHIDISHTDCSHTKQQPEETAVVDKLRSFIVEPLTDKELSLLYSASDGNIRLIQEKYALMQTQNVHNVMGFLIAAIKRDFQPPQKHSPIAYLQGLKNNLLNKIQFAELSKQYPDVVIKIDDFITLLVNILGSKEDFPVIDENLYYKKFAATIADSLSYTFMERMIATSIHKDSAGMFEDCLSLCNRQAV